MITILTWLWAQPGGRTQFTADHVNIWAAMVRRHVTVPHRIACVTDIPDCIDPSIAIIAPPREFEEVRIPTWPEAGARGGRPQCLRRIAMFGPRAAEVFGERFACMDLDVVIANSLDAILSTPEDFRICKGTAHTRPYNGSLIVMTAGSRPEVYDRFTPEAAVEAGQRFVGSDQAWIAHCLGPDEAVFDLGDGVQMSLGAFDPGAALTFYPGRIKPWDVVRLGGNAWAEAHYRADRRGSGLYLGYGDSVWTDAAFAFENRAAPLSWTCASPEAAARWTGRIDAEVRSDGEARRLARMLGYDLTICGASDETALGAAV